MENIITRDELLQHISQTIGKSKVTELTVILYQQKFEIGHLAELTFYPDKEIAFRAAWILENLFLTDPVRFIGSVGDLISKFLIMENESCLRHYTKILMHLTGKKADKQIAHEMQNTDMEPVAERCFDFLIDPASPIAVKVFAMEVLFNLRLRYHWITEILADQVKILMESGGPGIRARGRKVLKQLA